jgi:DASS family divalent anion:Na+ symporter
MLGFASSLCASLTHYGTGSAPVLFGAGYVTMNEWWKLGLISSVLNLLIWLGTSMIWWKIIGLW